MTLQLSTNRPPGSQKKGESEGADRRKEEDCKGTKCGDEANPGGIAATEKRLIEKASRLNNEEPLEVFRQRHENQEARIERGKAKAKGKAKPKAAPE